jgi:hypothetical protein
MLGCQVRLLYVSLTNSFIRCPWKISMHLFALSTICDVLCYSFILRYLCIFCFCMLVSWFVACSSLECFFLDESLLYGGQPSRQFCRYLDVGVLCVTILRLFLLILWILGYVCRCVYNSFKGYHAALVYVIFFPACLSVFLDYVF